MISRKSMAVLTAAMVLSCTATSAMADGLNGRWVSQHGTVLHIHNSSAKVDVYSVRPLCGGSFHAAVHHNGNQVTLRSVGTSKYGGQSFSIHFVLSHGELREVKPYPSGGMYALGYWHGMSCDFGLSAGGAVFQHS